MNDSFSSQLDEFFSALSPEERQKLLSGEGIWKKRVLAHGEAFFHEGEESTDLYLILRGRVEILKRIGQATQRKLLAVLEAGSVFGEGALLSNKSRSASAMALGEVEVLVLGKAGFDLFVRDEPKSAVSLLLGLLKVVNRRLISTNQELVTLYEMTQLMSDHKDDLPGLIQEIADRLAEVTGAPRGLIALKKEGILEYEVLASWGGLEFSSEELEGGLEFRAPITSLKGLPLGVVVMQRDGGEWLMDHKKVARMIADQLGIVLEDYHFMESEADRSKLKQQNISF